MALSVKSEAYLWFKNFMCSSTDVRCVLMFLAQTGQAVAQYGGAGYGQQQYGTTGNELFIEHGRRCIGQRRVSWSLSDHSI